MTLHNERLLEMLEEAAQFNSVFTITTKYGNAVIISEDDYRSMLETAGVDYNKWVEEKECSNDEQ